MSEYRLGEIETQFADLIWDNEPLSSGELVKLAAQKLSWKKSTTYTILRRLCEKGIFQNQDSVVTSLISKEELQSAQSEKFVEDTFAGTLPQFLTAFARRKKLSKQEIDEIQRFIDENRG
jgi:predicted transcriptional regulator